MKRFIKNRPVIEDKPIVEKDENEIVKQRNFQQNKYIEFLKRFIKDKCDYDYQILTHIDQIRESYNLFMSENKAELNQYNVSFAITPSDIPKLDNRFEFKLITVCKHCLSKQFKGCCDKYVRLDRTKLSYIVNLKLK